MGAQPHAYTGSRPVAHATIIKLSDTWVDVVADAIGVRIGLTRTATFSKGVELVAIAVAVAVTATDAALVKDVAVTVAGDVGASALVDLAWSVAHATSVELSDTWVDVVADAIGIGVGLTRPATFSEGVELVTVTIAIFCRDAVTATDATLVEDVSVAVAVSFRDVSTSALVDVAWSVAHATGVELSDTWVNVVADAVGVRISLTRTSALSKGVKLVAVTVAVSRRDAVTATDAALVKDVAVTIAVSRRDAVAATGVELSNTRRRRRSASAGHVLRQAAVSRSRPAGMSTPSHPHS